MALTDLPAHRRPDGTFCNPPGSPPREAGAAEVFRFLRGRVFDKDRIETPSGHLLEAEAVRRGLLSAPNPSVTWLGHAAFLIRLGGKVALTDPFLGDTAGPAGFGPRRHVPPALAVDALPPIDLLLISHDHYDHLDLPTLKALAGKADIDVVVPLGLGERLRRLGYAKVQELDWWQAWHADGLAIRLLPAVHSSGRGLFDRNRTLWGSFGLEAEDARLSFSGDTAYGAVFREIGARAGPFDLAMVGIGAYEPRRIMKPVHAAPEEAVKILRDIRARRGIGMHWGTIRLSAEPDFEAPGRFTAAARAQGYGEENAVILKIGETLAVGARAAVTAG